MPASYLQGFTRSGTRTDYLWAHDYEDTKSFRSKPDAIGFSRDLYRFRSNPKTDKDMDIEDALSKVDEDGARVIAKLEKEVGEPGFDDADHEADEAELVILLHYACIMHLRNPAFRRSLAALAGNQATLEMQLKAWSLSGPEELEKELGKDGVVLSPGVDVGELLEWMKSPGFRVEINDPDWLLVQSFTAEVDILKLLMQRRWRLSVVARGEGCFVASDRPMALMWRRPHPVGVLPGFAHEDTHVFFPLTKHLALYGSYGQDCDLVEASRSMIAVTNHVMVSTCDRFVYAAEESFPESFAGEVRDSPGDDYRRERMW